MKPVEISPDEFPALADLKAESDGIEVYFDNDRAVTVYSLVADGEVVIASDRLELLEEEATGPDLFNFLDDRGAYDPDLDDIAEAVLLAGGTPNAV